MLDRVCIQGVTLDELEVARTRPNRKVKLLRDLTAEEFQAHMRQANDPDRRYVINYSREHIFGAGAGHHSPIGGNLEGEDRVVVLDVDCDYEPWIVGRPGLLSAMDV